MFSCKKKDVEPQECVVQPNPLPTVENADYFPLKVESVWIYERIIIDSNGVETSNGQFTTEITGDTIIGGLKFAIFNNYNQNPLDVYLRDSSGVIVDNLGNIKKNFVDFTTIESGVNQFLSDWMQSYQLISDTNNLYSVPAGNFNTVYFNLMLWRVDGTPIDSCGNIYRIGRERYAKGVGLVSNDQSYYSDVPQCIKRENRLIFYDIPL